MIGSYNKYSKATHSHEVISFLMLSALYPITTRDAKAINTCQGGASVCCFTRVMYTVETMHVIVMYCMEYSPLTNV